jgi:ribosomal protein S18 acetylase RimI-like enzyme
MLHYTTDPSSITAAQLAGGFWVGWPNPPSPETHLRLLRGSDHVVLAIDDESGMVVGFITAISDGVLTAYIPLLEVLPDYQHRGIGGELLRRMLDRLGSIYMVDLLCDAELQPYYERFGMQRATGMFLRNYAAQSGALESR